MGLLNNVPSLGMNGMGNNPVNPACLCDSRGCSDGEKCSPHIADVKEGEPCDVVVRDCTGKVTGCVEKVSSQQQKEKSCKRSKENLQDTSKCMTMYPEKVCDNYIKEYDNSIKEESQLTYERAIIMMLVKLEGIERSIESLLKNQGDILKRVGG
jgi:hypothetical protein